MPLVLGLLLAASSSFAEPLPATGSWAPTGPRWVHYRALAQAERDAIYGRLVELCDGAGHRLAGSPGQKKAEEIGAAWLRKDGLKVRLDPLKVPVWVRGEERLTLMGAREESLDLLALGGSVGTPEGGIEAPVVVVKEFSELGPHVKGKIVVYNHPMGAGFPAISEYGPAVAFRGRGASRAAEFGAVAVLVRSVTARTLASPHPGAMGYEVAGFFFWQGERDAGNAGHAALYEANLVAFIQALRQEFQAPNARFVCATLGEATKEGSGPTRAVLDAHLAVDGTSGKYPEFRGNVATVYTHPLAQGGSGNGHYGGKAEVYMDVGEAMGQAMVRLLQETPSQPAK